jgi:serpin B
MTANPFHLAISSMLLATVLATTSVPTQTAADSATDSLVAGNTAFAFDLYSRLRTGDGNLFFSPYSISTCLGMTYTGARGDTATQMAGVLHFDSDPAKLAASFANLQAQLARSQSQGNIELNLANGLWSQKDHPFQSDFLKTARSDFSAKLNQVDFRIESEPARAQINDWVSSQTKGKIKDLLPTGVVNASTRLVLVNAIYFKGSWAKQFQKRNTSVQPFHITPSQDVQAPMMSLQKTFRYADGRSVAQGNGWLEKTRNYTRRNFAQRANRASQGTGSGRLPAQIQTHVPIPPG